MIMRFSTTTGVLALAVFLASTASTGAQTTSFTVTLDKPVHGTVTVAPPIPADGKVAAGTVVTVTAVPDAGFTIDSVYYSSPGRFGQMFYESMVSPLQGHHRQGQAPRRVLHREGQRRSPHRHAGRRLREAGREGAQVRRLLAEGREEPAGDRDHPRRRMDGQHRGHHARHGPRADAERASTSSSASTTAGRQKGDGDAAGNTMANLIEDVFGAIAHIQEHAATLRGRSHEDRRHRRQRGRSPVGRGHHPRGQDRLRRLRQDRGRVRVHAHVPAEGQDRRTGESRDGRRHQGGGAELRRVRRRPAQPLLG